MVKLQQKISGSWRTISGAEGFLALRSYLSTAVKHGHDVLDVLTRLAERDPGFPRPPRSDMSGDLNSHGDPYNAGAMSTMPHDPWVDASSSRSTIETPVVVSILVVTYRQRELRHACLSSVRLAVRQTPVRCELVVVDNGSDGQEATAHVRRAFPEAAIVSIAQNAGLTPALCQGLEATHGEWVLLLNDDVTLQPDAIAELLSVAGRSTDIGSIGALMLFAGKHRRGMINSASLGLDRLCVPFDQLLGEPAEAAGNRAVEVFGACGGAALYRRAMLDSIGGFDETFGVYLEDADVSWRAQMAGWRCFLAPSAVAHHHHSATTRHGSDYKYWHVGRNRIRLLAKNATTAHLLLHLPGLLAYECAYIIFVGLTDRTAAPLKGRLRGLREWRIYRRAVANRRPVPMTPVEGLRRALKRRAVWLAR